jgi:hypothetical protein
MDLMFEWLLGMWHALRRGRIAVPSADHRAFEAAVTSAFKYLSIDYGYIRQPLRVIAYERSVEFNRAGARVIVQQEIGAAPWVTLLAPKPIARGLRREFGLRELEQEMEKRGTYARTSASPATIQESVDLLATTLAQIGNEVLNGDFSILFERLQRHVDAVGKNI